MKQSVFVFAALLALASCETTRYPAQAFNVIDARASIPNRALIQEISFLDDDVLLIRVAASELYRIRLIPGCTNYADVGVGAQFAGMGTGIDRSTTVVIGNNACAIRSIERVERAN